MEKRKNFFENDCCYRALPLMLTLMFSILFTFSWAYNYIYTFVLECWRSNWYVLKAAMLVIEEERKPVLSCNTSYPIHGVVRENLSKAQTLHMCWDLSHIGCAWKGLGGQFISMRKSFTLWANFWGWKRPKITQHWYKSLGYYKSQPNRWKGSMLADPSPMCEGDDCWYLSHIGCGRGWVVNL